jgi:hypothetical protein
MATEAQIVKTIQRVLDQRGAWHYKTTGVSVAGIPDLAVAYRGRALHLEVKQPGRKPTARQAYQLDRARRAGAIAEVVTSPHEVELLLDSVDQEHTHP